MSPTRGTQPLWVLIPVKPFGEGKSRLAPRLSRAQRAELSRALLARVLHATAAENMPAIAGRVVVSRDPAALQMATSAGAHPLRELTPELNAALEQGRAFAVAQGAQALLVLPADLPNVSPAALEALLRAAVEPAECGNHDWGAPWGVAIVASATGGTNALLLQPADAIPFAFGPASALRHCALARARGLPARWIENPALLLDVDLPADLPDELPEELPDALSADRAGGRPAQLAPGAPAA